MENLQSAPPPDEQKTAGRVPVAPQRSAPALHAEEIAHLTEVISRLEAKVSKLRKRRAALVTSDYMRWRHATDADYKANFLAGRQKYWAGVSAECRSHMQSVRKRGKALLPDMTVAQKRAYKKLRREKVGRDEALAAALEISQ